MTSILYMVSMLALGADYLQSREILANRNFVEGNPVINKTGADIYFGFAALANTSVLLLDNESDQRAIFATVAAVEAAYIAVNRRIGVRVTVTF